MDDPMLIFAELHAESFLRAYERCIKPAGQGLGTPALICAALSAELGLKAILARHRTPTGKEHKLKKLLELIPAPDREWIVHTTAGSFPDFDQQLEKASEAFVDWRYIYESKTPKELNIFFVGAFASAISQRIVKARNADQSAGSSPTGS